MRIEGLRIVELVRIVSMSASCKRSKIEPQTSNCPTECESCLVAQYTRIHCANDMHETRRDDTRCRTGVGSFHSRAWLCIVARARALFAYCILYTIILCSDERP